MKEWNSEAKNMLLINKLRLSLNWKKIDFTLILIGQTKRKFCDKFSEHRGYVSQKKSDLVCGEHFNNAGHSHFTIRSV